MSSTRSYIAHTCTHTGTHTLSQALRVETDTDMLHCVSCSLCGVTALHSTGRNRQSWRRSSTGDDDEALGFPGQKCWSSRLVQREHRKLPLTPAGHRVPATAPVSSPRSPAGQAREPLPHSADEAMFGLTGHFNQQISKVIG